MKENSEMKAVLARKKKKTRKRDLSKSEGVHKHSKMKRGKKFETLFPYFEKQKERCKIKHENTRQVPCQ